MFPDRATLEEVAREMGISEAFVEKDWFVTRAIQVLAQDRYRDFQLVFTGGTALSKAHGLIERFSEDIDFRVMVPSLDGQGISRVKKTLSAFKKHVVDLLSGEFQIREVEARDSNRHFVVELAYSTICPPSDALRPHIKLEFTLSNLRLPSTNLPVSSFFHQVAGRAPEIQRIACLDPVENAADKLSALVWRVPSRVRGAGDRQPDLVRHVHDLAKLSGRALRSPHFAEVAHQTLEQDARRAEGQAGLSTPERLAAMLAILETDPAYPAEYETFVQGMSYARDADVPSFGEALWQVRRLAEAVTPLR